MTQPTVNNAFLLLPQANQSAQALTDSFQQFLCLPPSTLTDELEALFECPVCFRVILPPIMQCVVGHLVCSSCHPKLSSCPTCRGTLGNVRNLAIEKVASKLKFPCKQHAKGCTVFFVLNDKAKHEEVCKFRPYGCPCIGASCYWQQQLDKFIDYEDSPRPRISLCSNARDIVFHVTEIDIDAPLVHWAVLQSYYGHHFMLTLRKQEKIDGHIQFLAIVELLDGSRTEAEKFAYRLELTGNSRHLTWEGMPISSSENIDLAFDRCECLVLSNPIAQQFARNGTLDVRLTLFLAN